MKIIFHVDVNSAFLSWSAVKRLKEDPSALDLRTVPSAVGGDVKTRHGVITAKSIPAKRFGITTGEPVMTALRKCPDLILIPSDFQTYRQYSKAFIRILKQHSGLVEQVSIDEAFADMTGVPDPLAEAAALRAEIREKLQFTVNVGISENKLLAKMASDFEKPDRTHTLWSSEIPEKLWPLPIRELFGCGAATAARLNSFGIRTIGDAAGTDVRILQAILGEKGGAYIHRAANGISSSVLHPEEEDAKSYSNETTTAEDITLQNYAEALPPILRRLSEKVAARMKRDGVRASTIGVMVKTGAFQRHSRQTTLSFSTDDPAEIFRTADQLMHRLLFAGEGNTEAEGEQEETEDGLFSRGEVLRLVGVSAAKLTNEKEVYRQLSLFDLPPGETEQEKAQKKAREEAQEEARKKAQEEARKREAALKDMMDRINRRFGDKAVKKGTL